MSLYHKNQKTKDQEKINSLNQSSPQDGAATSAEQATIRPSILPCVKKLPNIPFLNNKILSLTKNGKELKAVKS